MIKNYFFEYGFLEAEATFKVDTILFTKEMAKATLEFFDWEYDEEADPVDEVMKKYAMKAIKIATFQSVNLYGVKKEFEECEGYGTVNGSIGVELISVNGYEFDNSKLEVKITTP